MNLTSTDEISCGLWLIALVEALGHFGFLGIFVWFAGLIGIVTLAYIIKKEEK